VAQDDVTALQRAGGGLPPARKTRVEQLVDAWLVVPDRDRMDRAESRGVEHEKGTVGCREQNIVRRLLSDCPTKNAFQRGQGGCCVTQKKCLIHAPRVHVAGQKGF